MGSVSPRYVHCGPFGQGVYVEVPTHEFAGHPPHPIMYCGSDLREQYWTCRCGTIVSEHLRVAASGRPCDLAPRCAICNAGLHHNRGYDYGELKRWAGYICPQCREAHKEALTLQPSPPAVAP